MTESRDNYISPLAGRYAGAQMRYLFSDQYKFRTFRRLWLMLAEAEQQLGLPISDEQLAELRAHLDDIDFAAAEAKEKQIRHDVMAHVYAYGLVCPTARPIIHLGATSAYVDDNADILIFTAALDIIEARLFAVVRALAAFADRYKDAPCLGYTHFQPAQPVTIGKRAALWLQDFADDIDDLRYLRGSLRPLGCKGTTGSGASFLALFDGDAARVQQLDQLIAEKMGFSEPVDVSGQTYSRKTDARLLGLLSGVAQSASKFATDIRLLQHEGELSEPRQAAQVGSSAMPYKRNPMRAERICALARYIITDALNPALTAASQWLERSLDDSANRRIAMAEGFLACDAVLNLVADISGGLEAHCDKALENLAAELPFMATENLMMRAVKAGGDRQELHEKIRRYAQNGAAELLRLIAADADFGLDEQELAQLLDPAAYTGVAARQVQRLLTRRIEPLLASYQGQTIETKVEV